MGGPQQFEFLTVPVSDAAPCGEDLGDSVVLPLSFKNILGRQVGYPKSGNEAPDWSGLKSELTAALEGTRDLRILPYLAAATLRIDGLEPFIGILGVAESWLTNFGAELYPRVEEGYDPRASALEGLCDFFGILDPLSTLPILSHATHGGLSLRDWEAANSAKAKSDSDDTEGKSVDAFREAGENNPTETIQAVRTALDEGLQHLDNIHESVLAFDTSERVDFKNLQRLLRLGLEVIDENAGHRLVKSSGKIQDSEPVSETVPQKNAVSFGGISTRGEAIEALDAVSRYFRAEEPSSPVPLMVEHAKRMVDKSFIDVLKVLVPDAVRQAEAAVGIQAGADKQADNERD